jgi:hypothetical protein
MFSRRFKQFKFNKKIMSYKYRPVPKDTDVLFLEVIKPLFWHNDDENNSKYYDFIPVGSITWMLNRKCSYNMIDGLPVLITGSNTLNAVTPENNRYYCNFDPSCFKILHTSKQKIKK